MNQQRHQTHPTKIQGRQGPDDRPPLPAGHPVCWGLITTDTVLHGAAYPFPVFLDHDA